MADFSCISSLSAAGFILEQVCLSLIKRLLFVSLQVFFLKLFSVYVKGERMECACRVSDLGWRNKAAPPWRPHNEVSSFSLVLTGMWLCEEMAELPGGAGRGAEGGPHFSLL